MVTNKLKHSILRLIPAIAIAITLSACTSPNSNQTHQRTAKSDSRMLNGNMGDSLSLASQDEFEDLVRNVDVKSKLMAQYANWKGVSYRLGGTNRSGIDCSAFVQRTFQEQFGMDLPRSTSEQQNIGMSVKRNNLRPGDSVLFKPAVLCAMSVFMSEITNLFMLPLAAVLSSLRWIIATGVSVFMPADELSIPLNLNRSIVNAN